MTTVTGAGDRSDARRNRARVLSAAGEAFAERGLDVPLGDIARRAGVGAGTVYRHFPSKHALVEAVFAQQLGELVASGERRMSRSAPTEAFFGFILEVVGTTRSRATVCDALDADASWPRPVLTATVARLHQLLETLLRAAQRDGGVRPEIGPDDVVALTVGCAAMLRVRHDRAAGIRLVRLTLDGLRPSAPVVTEGRSFRDNRGPHPAPACEQCGTVLTLRPTGRPARYCGAACRQRAHRSRPSP
ncbi:TetR/AcrR family transcriptional regulator [Kitasatospora purpeofusca]|uniref:TetR/AcrR family transcriptional regulator n=1 Tax=Kitasatospora purpeofusca TaxID=67352 RepID=UPI0022540464|nr:TetR/AcrR family transcriptional regulator [Kitasatospora purpeofusca]MCX4755830.1 TetR/AcrR family transcriptional regulator [Kitasatospora purpeofusca]WSR36314.1 TetR/AcrR family transcriptional regulator [Kitasatospora purpeofusca]